MLACTLQGRMAFSCILYLGVASADLSLGAALSTTQTQASMFCSAMRCARAHLLSLYYIQ